MSNRSSQEQTEEKEKEGKGLFVYGPPLLPFSLEEPLLTNALLDGLCCRPAILRQHCLHSVSGTPAIEFTSQPSDYVIGYFLSAPSLSFVDDEVENHRKKAKGGESSLLQAKLDLIATRGEHFEAMRIETEQEELLVAEKNNTAVEQVVVLSGAIPFDYFLWHFSSCEVHVIEVEVWEEEEEGVSRRTPQKKQACCSPGLDKTPLSPSQRPLHYSSSSNLQFSGKGSGGDSILRCPCIDDALLIQSKITTIKRFAMVHVMPVPSHQGKYDLHQRSQKVFSGNWKRLGFSPLLDVPLSSAFEEVQYMFVYGTLSPTDISGAMWTKDFLHDMMGFPAVLRGTSLYFASWPFVAIPPSPFGAEDNKTEGKNDLLQEQFVRGWCITTQRPDQFLKKRREADEIEEFPQLYQRGVVACEYAGLPEENEAERSSQRCQKVGESSLSTADDDSCKMVSIAQIKQNHATFIVTNPFLVPDPSKPAGQKKTGRVLSFVYYRSLCDVTEKIQPVEGNDYVAWCQKKKLGKV